MSIPGELYAVAIGKAVFAPEMLLIALAAASVMAAVAAGVLPPRGASGPDRVPPDRPAWPLLGVVFGAIGFYLLAASLYTTLRHSVGHVPSTQPQLDTRDMAFVGTVPPIVGFIVLALGGRFLGLGSGFDLSLGRKNILAGLVKGTLGAVIVLPPLFLTEQIVELIYRQLNYQHATEHPLLHMLGEQPGLALRVLLIGSACVVAPLFEETLFRGYVQTLLRRMSYRLTTPLPTPQPAEASLAASEESASIVSLPPRPTAIQTWAAIGLTSALFALVHPVWSMPVIFLLSLCLGYTYERTRNLWAPIFLHALFNSASTALYLLSN